MHLSICSDLPSEEKYTRDLMNAIFSLRVSWILNGTVVPVEAVIRGAEMPQGCSPQYSILSTLRKRVWRRFGWELEVGDPMGYPTGDVRR